MLRAKKLRPAFLFLLFVFCLYLSGVSGADDSCFQGLSTIPGNVKYFFKWDPTNPQEIGRNSNVEIKVIGGIPQYNWSVSGNGFNLSQSQSNGVSNILTADSTACGPGTITVTDRCGGTTTGYVRCTTGKWTEITFDSCVITGAITEGDGRTRIEGKWKLYEYWGGACSSTGLACQHANPNFGLCEATYYDNCKCLDLEDCHTTMGCTQCLDHGGICPAGYPVECFSPSDCLCCMEAGGSCTALGFSAITMCNRQESKLYEWTCP